jgi:hypothetical protein
MGAETVVRTRGDLEIEVVDEPTYTFGSVDNVRRYQREELLCRRDVVVSRHGVSCMRGGQVIASVVIGAAGGATGVHAHSVAFVEDACLVAVGPQIACLDLPFLGRRWVREVDEATCFGIHVAPDGSVVSHGELQIARLTVAGDILWRASGRDIFTGEMSVSAGLVRVEDFDGYAYAFDLQTGRAVAGFA